MELIKIYMRREENPTRRATSLILDA